MDVVARATGISRDTIQRGLAELDAGEPLAAGRIRRPGGGRRALVEDDPTLVQGLQRLIDPDTRGDPESPLRWTSKSSAKLAVALRGLGYQVSDRTVLKLLKHRLGYSLQGNPYE